MNTKETESLDKDILIEHFTNKSLHSEYRHSVYSKDVETTLEPPRNTSKVTYKVEIDKNFSIFNEENDFYQLFEKRDKAFQMLHELDAKEAENERKKNEEAALARKAEFEAAFAKSESQIGLAKESFLALFKNSVIPHDLEQAPTVNVIPERSLFKSMFTYPKKTHKKSTNLKNLIPDSSEKIKMKIFIKISSEFLGENFVLFKSKIFRFFANNFIMQRGTNQMLLELETDNVLKTLQNIYNAMIESVPSTRKKEYYINYFEHSRVEFIEGYQSSTYKKDKICENVSTKKIFSFNSMNFYLLRILHFQKYQECVTQFNCIVEVSFTGCFVVEVHGPDSNSVKCCIRSIQELYYANMLINLEDDEVCLVEANAQTAEETTKSSSKNPNEKAGNVSSIKTENYIKSDKMCYLDKALIYNGEAHNNFINPCHKDNTKKEDIATIRANKNTVGLNTKRENLVTASVNKSIDLTPRKTECISTISANKTIELNTKQEYTATHNDSKNTIDINTKSENSAIRSANKNINLDTKKEGISTLSANSYTLELNTKNENSAIHNASKSTVDINTKKEGISTLSPNSYTLDLNTKQENADIRSSSKIPIDINVKKEGNSTLSANGYTLELNTKQENSGIHNANKSTIDIDKEQEHTGPLNSKKNIDITPTISTKKERTSNFTGNYYNLEYDSITGLYYSTYTKKKPLSKVNTSNRHLNNPIKYDSSAKNTPTKTDASTKDVYLDVKKYTIIDSNSYSDSNELNNKAKSECRYPKNNNSYNSNHAGISQELNYNARCKPKLSTIPYEESKHSQERSNSMTNRAPCSLAALNTPVEIRDDTREDPSSVSNSTASNPGDEPLIQKNNKVEIEGSTTVSISVSKDNVDNTSSNTVESPINANYYYTSHSGLTEHPYDFFNIYIKVDDGNTIVFAESKNLTNIKNKNSFISLTVENDFGDFICGKKLGKLFKMNSPCLKVFLQEKKFSKKSPVEDAFYKPYDFKTINNIYLNKEKLNYKQKDTSIDQKNTKTPHNFPMNQSNIQNKPLHTISYAKTINTEYTKPYEVNANEGAIENRLIYCFEMKGDTKDVVQCYNNLFNEFPFEENFSIESKHHKRIIGASGLCIQKIMKKHNVYVKFFSDFEPESLIGNVLIKTPRKNKKQMGFAKAEIFKIAGVQPNPTPKNTKEKELEYMCPFESIQDLLTMCMERNSWT